MTAFAGSAEVANVTFYGQIGFSGSYTPRTTQKHQTLAGLGGNYSWGLGNYSSFPSHGTGERYWHAWVVLSGNYTLRFCLGSEIQASLTLAGYSTLYRGNSATLLATSTISVNMVGPSHWIAVELLAQDAGGIFTLWCDEVQLATYNGDTQQLASPDWDRVDTSGGYTTFYFDDVITTSAAEGRLQEQFCQFLVPSANVACAFTPVPAGAGTNWERVNEIPASQTDYCEATALAQEDVYDLTNPGSAFTSVWCTSAWTWAARDGTITQVRSGVSSAADGVATYRTYFPLPASPSWAACWQVASLDPSTGAPWTGAGLNDARLHFQAN